MNKLFGILLLATTILICASTCACSKSEGKSDGGNQEGGNTSLAPSGQVTCEGKGIADVVVSDGFAFTQTDQRGFYQLPYNNNAIHIFISTPSGYTVAVDRSSPKYWVRIADCKDHSKINFELIATGDDVRHWFVAIGDPQIRDVDTEKGKLSTKCDQILADIQKLGATIPVHIMVTGDVAFNNPAIHAYSRSCFTKLGQPVYYAIGNHDHTPTEKSDTNYKYDKTSISDFVQNYGPTCYSFNRGKVHYIVYDNIYFYGGSSGSAYDIRITDEQLAWIAKDLTYVTKDHAVVLMSHSPTQTRRAPSPTSYGNSDKLHALVNGYANVQFITGHTHYNSVCDANGVTEHTIGALCGAFWTGNVCLDGTILGYKIFEVNGTTFKWHYVPADDSYKNKQFSLFTQASSATPLSKVSVLANVWDWDSKWQVQYSTDGGTTWSDMTQSDFTANTSYDPTAYYSLGTTSDDGKPTTSRSWINATTTDHLFSAAVASGITAVKVRAINRFGESYTQDISL